MLLFWCLWKLSWLKPTWSPAPLDLPGPEALQLPLLAVYLLPVPGHRFPEHTQNIFHCCRHPLVQEHPKSLHLWQGAAKRLHGSDNPQRTGGVRREHQQICGHDCWHSPALKQLMLLILKRHEDINVLTINYRWS